MSDNRIMRLFRQKHQIGMLELAVAAGVTSQRIAQIELYESPSTAYHRQLMDNAFALIIARRKEELFRLEEDFIKYRTVLLDFTEEESL